MELPANHLLWLVPKHYRHAVVHQRGYEVFIEFPNAFGRRIHDPAVPLLALPKFLLRFFALSEFALKPLVGLFEALAGHAEFLERARVGDDAADVVGINVSPNLCLIRHVGAGEHRNDSHHLTVVNYRPAMEPADFLRLEPFEGTEFARILVQIVQHDLVANQHDFAGDADAQWNTRQVVGPGEIFHSCVAVR